MRILVADDEPVSRHLLVALLAKWEHEAVVCEEGISALRILQGENSPGLAILDWLMPGLDGVEICRRVRSQPSNQSPYLILLTAREEKKGVITGLDAGANDYVRKPFDAEELRARVNVGSRVVELQTHLTHRVRQLEEAAAHIHQLQGILPICMYCKKIRDDQESWQRLEKYIEDHSGAEFSHGICPDCLTTRWGKGRESESCLRT